LPGDGDQSGRLGERHQQRYSGDMMPTRGRKLPQLMETAVKKIKRASPGVNPYAVASATLQKSGSLKKGTNKPTAKGVARGKKSETWRKAHPP
jgi:hypothetical protein